jgi:molybdopterin-synthase adenylyltransferase
MTKMISRIHQQIREKAIKISDPAGRDVHVIKDHAALDIACQHSLSLRDVYIEALRLLIYPYRYIRNMDIISPAEQLKLAESQVAIVGAGGLGGQVIILLARIGIGRLIVVDHDQFDETNLNRQALCSQEALQKSKSQTAVETAASINPGIRVIAHQQKIGPAGSDQMLAGSDVIVDALDNVPDRLMLQEAARRLGVPMVHGALAGFEGRIMTVYPGDPGLKQLYDIAETAEVDKERPEALLGVPAVTASVIGAFQTMEVLKVLLHRGKIFRNIMAHIDLENGRLEEFCLDRPSGSNDHP